MRESSKDLLPKEEKSQKCTIIKGKFHIYTTYYHGGESFKKTITHLKVRDPDIPYQIKKRARNALSKSFKDKRYSMKESSKRRLH